MSDLEELNTAEARESPNRYVMGAVIVLALLALPETRFQSLFRMAVWTTILFSAGFSVVRRAVKDSLGWVVVAALCVVHFVLMGLLLPYVEAQGYIGIGLSIVAEILLFSIPIGWLVLRSRRIELDSDH